MDLVEVLTAASDEILGEATEALTRSRQRHYEQASEAERRARLEQLFDVVLRCLRERDLVPVVHRAEQIAHERFEAGYDIGEVQTAFNVLEESIWRHIVSSSESDQLVERIALGATVLGAGRDALARAYVSLAAHEHVPSLDVTALFRGTA